jgi:hypothetical protein
MEVYKGYFGIPDIVKPPADFSAEIIWVLGQDQSTQGIAEKLGYHPKPQELDFTSQVVQRHPDTPSQLLHAMGRSADFRASPQTIFGMPYNTLEIGGYGYFELTTIGQGMGIVRPEAVIDIPSNSNFTDIHRDIIETEVVEGSKRRTLSDNYYFTGAYTRDQAIRKLAANLFFVEQLAEQDKPPFIVPVPIAAGYYPSILNDESSPAHFIAWRVPYEGRRLGYFNSANENQLETINKAANKVIMMGGVLRVLHDVFGLTHNQPTLSNFYTSDVESDPPYLADFSTIFPISKERPDLSRTQDLGILILANKTALVNLRSTIGSAKLTEALYRYCLNEYLGKFPANLSSLDDRTVLKAINTTLKKAARFNQFPAALPTEKSWHRISQLKAQLNNAFSSI